MDEKKADARTEEQCQWHFGGSFEEAWKDDIAKGMKGAHQHWEEWQESYRKRKAEGYKDPEEEKRDDWKAQALQEQMEEQKKEQKRQQREAAKRAKKARCRESHPGDEVESSSTSSNYSTTEGEHPM